MAMEVTIDMVDMSMLAVIPPFPVRYGLSQSRSGSQEAKYSALRLIESKSPSEGLMPSLPKNSQRAETFSGLARPKVPHSIQRPLGGARCVIQ